MGSGWNGKSGGVPHNQDLTGAVEVYPITRMGGMGSLEVPHKCNLMGSLQLLWLEEALMANLEHPMDGRLDREPKGTPWPQREHRGTSRLGLKEKPAAGRGRALRTAAPCSHSLTGSAEAAQGWRCLNVELRDGAAGLTCASFRQAVPHGQRGSPGGTAASAAAPESPPSVVIAVVGAAAAVAPVATGITGAAAAVTWGGEEGGR